MTTRDLPGDSLIEGMARVVAVDGDQVWLVAQQPVACGSCATRSGCGGAGIARTNNRWRVSRSLEPGQTLLDLGDTVVVGLDRSALTRALLAAYSLPLLAMLLSASAAQGAGNLAAIAGALAGLLVGIAGARLLARRWRDALEPVVLSLATDCTTNTCGPSNMARARTLDIPVVHRGGV